MHKIALIGAGRIGRIHAANVASRGDLELAFVVDPAPEAARAAAEAHGARVASFDDALGERSIAGVIIASSTDTHLAYALAAAEAGKTIFCEKPLDLDLEKSRAARARFAAANGRLFLAFNRRFDPNFQALKAKLESGAVGSLETLHIISHDPAPPHAGYIHTSGGLFKDMAIHDFDMARWLLGEEISEVFAAGACLVDPAIGRAGDIDTAKTLLRTASGKLCAISNSRRSGYGYDQRIEAFGSRGALRVGNVVASTVEVWTETGAQADVFENFFLDRYAEAYRREMAHFADMLTSGAAPLIGYEDGVAALALAQAAQDSLVRGVPVLL